MRFVCEMGVDYSDLWEEFENEHSGMITEW